LMFAVEVNSGTQIASGAQLGAALRDERAALVQFEPATRTDPGPRFGMLANVASVVSRRSPIVFSPVNFTAFRIRVGKRTISTRVSPGRSGPWSNMLPPIHLALNSHSTSRRIWGARVR